MKTKEKDYLLIDIYFPKYWDMYQVQIWFMKHPEQSYKGFMYYSLNYNPILSMVERNPEIINNLIEK